MQGRAQCSTCLNVWGRGCSFRVGLVLLCHGAPLPPLPLPCRPPRLCCRRSALLLSSSCSALLNLTVSLEESHCTEAGPAPSPPLQASEAGLWAERASSLVFLQYFWFRHSFLLGPTGTAGVLGVVTARLADAKLEVRELAAMTLSGESG